MRSSNTGNVLPATLQDRPSALAYLPAPTDAFSDEWIVRLVRQGDARAFEQLVERYREPLSRYCRGVTGHVQDAEEAFQTALLKAYQALRRGDQVTALRPWLITIARNACLDLIRQRPDWATLTAEQAARGDDPGDMQVTRERFEGLRRDLADLKELHRSALLLRELNGMSHREIGDALGTSPESAKRLIFEARESLVERAAGRELDCADVRARISEHDGRMLRSRRLRAHLDECPCCSDYRATLLRRPRQLAALFPVLPAAAAVRILQGLGLSGAAGGGGGIGAMVGSLGGGSLVGGLSTQTAAILAVATVAGGALVPGLLVADRSPQASSTTLAGRVTAPADTERPATARTATTPVLTGAASGFRLEPAAAPARHRAPAAEPADQDTGPAPASPPGTDVAPPPDPGSVPPEPPAAEPPVAERPVEQPVAPPPSTTPSTPVAPTRPARPSRQTPPARGGEETPPQAGGTPPKNHPSGDGGGAPGHGSGGAAGVPADPAPPATPDPPATPGPPTNPGPPATPSPPTNPGPPSTPGPPTNPGPPSTPPAPPSGVGGAPVEQPPAPGTPAPEAETPDDEHGGSAPPAKPNKHRGKGSSKHRHEDSGTSGCHKRDGGSISAS